MLHKNHIHVMNVAERTIAPEILDKIATFHETTVDYLLGRTNDKTDYTKKKIALNIDKLYKINHSVIII